MTIKFKALHLIMLQLPSSLSVPLFQDLSIEEQSECTQDFYQSVAERMQTRGKGNIAGLLAVAQGQAAGSLKARLVYPLHPINYSSILVAGLVFSSAFEYHHVYCFKIIRVIG